MMENKPFDCVEMKHQAAEKIQARLAGMSDEEKIEYLHGVAEEFREWQAAIRLGKGNANSPETRIGN